MAMSQGIYKITNLINDKTYIGQSVNIEKRWKEHIRTSLNKKRVREYQFPLYRSFRKYGTDNFNFEILELVPNKKDLEKKELYYYEMYKTEYNQEVPVKRIRGTKLDVFFQIDMETHEVVGKFNDMYEVKQKLKKNTTNIYKVLEGKKKSALGYYWCYEKDYDNWQPPTYIERLRKVVKIDMKTNEVLDEYNSIKEASIKNNILTHNINRVCGLHRLSAGGYIWRYVTND
jgi:group I intron endonuclease